MQAGRCGLDGRASEGRSGRGLRRRRRAAVRNGAGAQARQRQLVRPRRLWWVVMSGAAASASRAVAAACAARCRGVALREFYAHHVLLHIDAGQHLGCVGVTRTAAARISCFYGATTVALFDGEARLQEFDASNAPHTSPDASEYAEDRVSERWRAACVILRRGCGQSRSIARQLHERLGKRLEPSTRRPQND